MKGVWRKSFLAARGSDLADSAMRLVVSIASEVCLRAASAACLMVFEVDMMGGRGEAGWYIIVRSSTLITAVAKEI